ncbi:stress up-regulated Nod 19 protein [Populus alba x Populus x berolinensis]|nr:stress up-regulated Nod 19 protein [Populus alba x Populus x berolinensis]
MIKHVARSNKAMEVPGGVYTYGTLWNGSIGIVTLSLLKSLYLMSLIPEKGLNVSDGLSPENGCQVEYDVEPCGSATAVSDGCIDVQRTSLTMPVSGYVIYGVAHQHTGGIGSTLFGEEGRVICTSEPIYGEGKDAGDEAGYVSRMSTCYPEPGSIQITAGENLVS